jgi:hypothetical protein
VPPIPARSVTALQHFFERLRFTLIALVVSTFPESVKGSGWPAAYASAGAHAFGGWVETLASAGLFGIGFLRHVTGFSRSTGWTYLSNLPTSTIWDWRGVGLIGFLSYLVTPIAWVTLYCFVEGILRALDAAYSERMLGMAFVAVPWRGALALRKSIGRRQLETRLGPERPDEVIVGKVGAPVALTVFAAREKPWADYQVIEYEGDFYEAIEKRLVERGGHHAYRYEFRHLEHGDIIRGVLLRYPPEEPPQPNASARRGEAGSSEKPAR